MAFSSELYRRYGDQGILSISVNPGSTKSESTVEKAHWVRNLRVAFRADPLYHYFLQPTAIHSSSTAALALLWAGTAPEAGTLGGKVRRLPVLVVIMPSTT